MNGNWLRVTAAELARAKGDLDWAYGHAEAAVEGEDERWLWTYKTWHALGFLLERYGFGVPIVFGAVPFAGNGGRGGEFSDESDWGYGPPRYLTAEQVSAAAAELSEIAEDGLIQGVDPAELTRAEIYPGPWETASELQWAVQYLPDIKSFFASAAKNGDTVICWLD